MTVRLEGETAKHYEERTRRLRKAVERLERECKDPRVYGQPGIMRVIYFNAGACGVAIVAKMGGGPDWAAYMGGLPNPATEAEVVEETVRHGGKLLAEWAVGLWPSLPLELYRA